MANEHGMNLDVARMVWRSGGTPSLELLRDMIVLVLGQAIAAHISRATLDEWCPLMMCKDPSRLTAQERRTLLETLILSVVECQLMLKEANTTR
jgi:hypothetical protein